MEKFKQPIIKELQRLTKIKNIILEEPPTKDMGDLAFPCFSLAKLFKKDPVQIAQDIAKDYNLQEPIKEVKVIGPYVNFFIDKAELAKEVLTNIAKEQDKYGSGEKKKEKIMIEFSGPNTHKSFHIGHLRNTVLGESLARILKYNGNKVTSANYINETGMHVAKCLWGYQKYGKKPTGNKGQWLGRIYTKASKEIAEDEFLQAEATKLHKKIEDKDPELMKLWEETKIWSVDDFKRIYKELDVHFDNWDFDSTLTDKGKAIVCELLTKKIAKKSQGAIIVNLKKYGLNVALILKSDETALYITKDLALAKERFNKHKIDKLIYVVGSQQQLHFQQLFKILSLYGFKQADECFHLSYEMVNLASGKMSSREGNVVLYSELFDEVYEKALSEVKKRHKEWPKPDIAKSAKNIALAAMKFSMLSYDNNKTIIFDIEKALDFEGETGPYIQYAHARICSILRKAVLKPKKADFRLYKAKIEHKLISLLGDFPVVVEEAAKHYKPNLVVRYLLDLSQCFNEFYHECQILQERAEIRDARLLLVTATKQVLENGLKLLAIEAPNRM